MAAEPGNVLGLQIDIGFHLEAAVEPVDGRVDRRIQPGTGEVHRIEAETEAASDERTETLKKKRLALLDEITEIVTRARKELV